VGELLCELRRNRTATSSNEDRLAELLVVARDRVVVVVDGVMSIQGDGNTVRKAKDHSHEYFGEEMLSVKREWCSLS
jgi:hypothetical protein